MVAKKKDSAPDTAALHAAMPLRDDNPSSIDLLGFQDVVRLVEEIVTRKDLDPVTVGVNAPWGGGKTTVLQLLKDRLDARGEVLCLLVSPWEYDNKTDPTTALIDEVLGRLNAEVKKREDFGQKAKGLLVKLRRRVKFAKALKLAATATLTATVPTVGGLIDLFDENKPDDEVPPDPTLQGFRQEFADIMTSEGLAPLERVVVLVDDLDRSLPDTVVETLEAIKLFLSVKKMAFVVAADEANVAQAIGRRLSETGQTIQAHLYLEKIIQVPVRVPALGREQTEEYLALLMLADLPQVDRRVARIQETRPSPAGRVAERLGDALPEDRKADVQLAERLAPLLHRQTAGNPRRLKRFLNAFWLRMSFATARGVDLKPDALAKLMLAELHYPDFFGQLLAWLSAGVVAEKVAEIEKGEGDHSEQVLEWGSLDPELSSEDLAKYLLLAASLRGETLEEALLSPELREVADQLSDLSDTRRREGLRASESLDDAKRSALARFLAVSLRHQRQPESQKNLAQSISGLVTSSAAAATAAEELRRMPHAQVTAGVPIGLLALNQPDEFKTLLNEWLSSEETSETTKNASRDTLETH